MQWFASLNCSNIRSAALCAHAQVGWWLLFCALLIPWNAVAVEEAYDIQELDDTPRVRDIHYPEWFKNSFLDLSEDLSEAENAGKIGIIVYFGQKHCAYCEALMDVNFGREEDIVEYTRKHFDVVPIDIWGSREVIDMQRREITEREYAEREKTNFTPSLVFYVAGGKEALRLRGYYPPYKFRAALEYVVDGYYKEETFRDYLARADPPPKFEIGDLNTQEFFESPPFALDRSRFPGQQPLVVFFEQRDCHACDILHTDPVSDKRTRGFLKDFEVVQLDMWSETPVLTPDGQRLTARQWAKQLGLIYAPALVFFDEGGKEVIRIESVVRLYRLQGVLEYVLKKGYREAPTFQRWREMQSQRVTASDT